jgi:hypothetical protein
LNGNLWHEKALDPNRRQALIESYKPFHAVDAACYLLIILDAGSSVKHSCWQIRGFLLKKASTGRKQNL